MNFNQQLQTKIDQTSAVVVGIDPDINLMDPRWLSQFFASGYNRVVERGEALEIKLLAQIYQHFGQIIIDAVVGLTPLVKIQMAFFEVLGSVGIQAVENLLIYAKSKKLMVMMDVKRSDVPSTARQYAETYLGNSPLVADAVTVNPYLGRDSLEPFFQLAEKNQRGVFVCLKTSNPGSGDLQDLQVAGEPLYQYWARQLQPYEKSGMLGVVVGATYPEEAKMIRQILTEAFFLVPGLGAQGGSLERAGDYLNPQKQKGLFNFSRSIIYPQIETDGATPKEAISDLVLQNSIRLDLKRQVAKLPF